MDQERLLKLLEADNGFFVLACAAFMEAVIKKKLPGRVSGYETADRFKSLSMEYGAFLEEKGAAPGAVRQALNMAGRIYFLSNGVRHEYAELDQDDARAAVAALQAFAGVSGLAMPVLKDKFTLLLRDWSVAETVGPKSAQAARMALEMDNLRKSGLEARAELERYRQAGLEAQNLRAELEKKEKELENLKVKATGKDERLDALRQERYEAAQKIDLLMKEREGLEKANRWLETQRRYTVLSRTRKDYERSLNELTAEQKAVADSLKDNGVLYVRGPAGTGKTLVLMECLRRSVIEAPQESDYVLLTFSRTLQKYDQYLLSLKGLYDGTERLYTIDSLVLGLLKKLPRPIAFAFDWLKKRLLTIGLPPELAGLDLAAEFEDLIWAGLYTREEYVDKRAERYGLKNRLSERQRALAWDLQEKLGQEMEAYGGVTRNYARVLLLRYMDTPLGKALEGSVGAAFIDEAQDLTAGDLRLVRRLTRGRLVLAADMGQGIFRPVSPFQRAGISLKGRSHVLRVNMRNTVPIALAAGRLLAAWGAPASQALAYRPGPPPVFTSCCDSATLLTELAGRVLSWRNDMGYDWENMAVLCASSADKDSVLQALSAAAIPAMALDHKNYAFETNRSVTVTTLQSSKGLDFPVVFLCLDHYSVHQDLDDAARDRMDRNLFYVAVTRAVDGLEILARECGDKWFTALREAVEGGDSVTDSVE